MTEFLVAILPSIAVLSAMAALLALLLVIADAWIGNYGECMITINGQKEIKVRGGQSLLAALAANRVFLPSACGGRGTCAYCKAKVLEGGGPVLPTETPLLTAEELKGNTRLSCQVKVRNDLRIEIPDELFNIREYRARVARITDLTHDIKEIRLELTAPETIAFKAGQYVQFRAPEYPGNKAAVYRAYSVASAPSDNRAVELVIRKVPGGICTTYVFEHLKEGDDVVFNGPYGDFTLRSSDAEIVFAAGGSGFAPIRAMLLDNPEELNRRGARYFFGAKEDRDLFYLDMMKDVTEKHANVKFIPILSKPPDGWEGETGLITHVLEKQLDDAAGKEFYLCGSPGMIDACVKVFTKKGASENVIFYDKFA